MIRFRALVAGLWLAAGTAFSAGSLEEGLAAYDSGDHKKAYAILAPIARAGDAVAQLKLGLLHYFGNGVKEDERAAVAWFRKSAESGNLDAMYQLGNAYTFGNEAAKLVADADVEAARWYHRAADAGHRDAQYALGLMFLAGKGVVQSQEEAAEWIARAAAQGHAEAQNFVRGLATPHK